MNNPISRFFTLKQTAPPELPAGDFVAVQDRVGAAEPPPTYRRGDTCTECGGYFRPEKMKTITRVTTILCKDGNTGLPHFERVDYCQNCAPPAPLILILLDDTVKGEVLDTRAFHVEHGWFQDVDGETGEERWIVSLEEYSHTFCTDCGELIEEIECQGCRKPEKKTGK